MQFTINITADTLEGLRVQLQAALSQTTVLQSTAAIGKELLENLVQAEEAPAPKKSRAKKTEEPKVEAPAVLTLDGDVLPAFKKFLEESEDPSAARETIRGITKKFNAPNVRSLAPECFEEALQLLGV
jgi:hypothetical protein